MGAIGLWGALLLSALPGCSDGDPDAPYVEFAGGGFVFNYRLAEAYYGFVVRRLRRIPAGTILEVEFEDPSGGKPIVIRQTALPTRLFYKFETPPVQGVRASIDYHVVLRLIDPATQRTLARYGRSFRSDVDQSILPGRPPVVGPGYQRS